MRLASGFLVLSLFLFAFGAHAATFTWDGGGADDLWSNPQNWAGDVAPGAGDDLVFPIIAPLVERITINDLAVTFNSIAINARDYVLQGAPIQVSNGITADFSGGSHIEAQVVTATSQTFDVTSAGLRFTGEVQNSGTLTLDGGNFTFEGVISGPGAIVVQNSFVDIQATNTFTGGITINGGTLGGSGTVGNVVVNPTGTITGSIRPEDPALTTGDVLFDGGNLTLSTLPSAPTLVRQLDVNGTVTIIGDSRFFFGFNASNAPAPGTVLTLIDNDGTDPIAGTFFDRSEGAVFEQNGRTFRISYVGGDGNDLTLTALGADLGVTKVVDDATPTAGQTVAFTITVSNAGPDPATNVELTDTLGAGLAFVSAAPSQGSCSGMSPVVCELGTINSGANATVTLVATAVSPGSRTNTASVSSDEFDPASGNNTDTETVAVGASEVAAVPALDARALAALALLLVAAGAFVLRS